MASGVAFRNGYQAHNASETCPGHSTILTGTRPARNGVIANNWIDQSVGREDQSVYCAEDERIAGTSSAKYRVSPFHLLVPTLGELVKARFPQSRSVAVSGKDRAAVMMSGTNVDQRWYLAGDKFVTDQPDAGLPKVISAQNDVIAAELAEPRAPMSATGPCAAKARPVTIENSGKAVGAGRFARNAEDLNSFRASPDLDAHTLAIASGLISSLGLGTRDTPDVLALSLSATDYVGHSYGTEGSEMCLQLMALDAALGRFFAQLDARGIDYSVVLTADHGGLDVPERQRQAGLNAARIDPDLNTGTIGLKVVNALGLPGFGLLGEAFGDVYVDRSLSLSDQARVLTAAKAAYEKHPQVQAVLTRNEIMAVPIRTGSPAAWTLVQRVRASYYAGRSGDLMVLLKPNVTPIFDTSRYVATHGSPWDYDRRVPMLFWRKGMEGVADEAVVDTVDIMPTLAAQIGLDLRSVEVDGRCLAVAAGNRCVDSRLALRLRATPLVPRR
jgi:predicted AlkP superfamily pyrophosphatase or phosphodiesterase